MLHLTNVFFASIAVTSPSSGDIGKKMLLRIGTSASAALWAGKPPEQHLRAGTPASDAPAGRGRPQELRLRGVDACQSCSCGAGTPGGVQTSSF
jgi:hypothetical protein